MAIRELLKVQKQEQVREEILKVAAKLFAERGYRAVTIDEIASEMGFAKSAVYYYFKNKQELLWRIFEEIYDSYIAMAKAVRDEGRSPEEALAQIIHRHILMVTERRDWTAIFFREESHLSDERQRTIRARKRQYDAIVEEIYSEGVKRGLFRSIPAHIAVSGIVGMCNWLYVWFDERGRIRPEQIADHYTTLLAHGYLEGSDRS